MVTNEIKSNRVILQLLGIDKKWVRSPKGEWVDAKTIEQPTRITEEQLEATQDIKKKWWKFW